MKITKTKRLEIIKNILRRWGKIDFEQLKIHYLANTNEDFDNNLKRKLYHDLDMLVRESILNEFFYSRDGIEIKDFSENEYRNYQKKWSFSGQNVKLLGESLINNFGGIVYVPSFLSNDVSIVDGTSPPLHKTTHLYFNVGSIFLALRIDQGSLPVTTHISRKTEDLNSDEIRQIEGLFTKRSIILKIPIGSISSFKDTSQPGHGTIEITSDRTATITDLGSANGTFVYKISAQDADKLRLEASLLGDETITQSWNSLNFDNFEKYEVTSENYNLPIVIQFSEGFKVLVI